MVAKTGGQNQSSLLCPEGFLAHDHRHICHKMDASQTWVCMDGFSRVPGNGVPTCQPGSLVIANCPAGFQADDDRHICHKMDASQTFCMDGFFRVSGQDVQTCSAPRKAPPDIGTAFCIVGLLRTLYCTPMWESIKANVIEDLGGGDVFVHIKLLPSESHLRRVADIAAGKLGSISTTVIDEEEAMSSVYRSMNPDCPLSRISDSSGPGCYSEPGCMKTKFAMVSKDQQRCFEMIKHQEYVRGHHYKHIVKLRSDKRFCSRWGGVRVLEKASSRIMRPP